MTSVDHIPGAIDHGLELVHDMTGAPRNYLHSVSVPRRGLSPEAPFTYLHGWRDRESGVAYDVYTRRVELDALEVGGVGRYSVKCDDCKRDMRRTDSVGESARGGRCEECRAAAGLREEADHLDAKAEESFDRSDTDGFLSQWALNTCAAEKRLEAQIIEQGGQAEFPALFDKATGERVRAKLVDVPGYQGWNRVSKWIVLDRNDKAVHWVPAFKAGPRSRLFQLGLEEGREMAPAKATLSGGNGRGLSGAVNVRPIAKRQDAGYPAEARTLAEIRKGA